MSQLQNQTRLMNNNSSDLQQLITTNNQKDKVIKIKTAAPETGISSPNVGPFVGSPEF
jgi:hypothetical protein